VYSETVKIKETTLEKNKKPLVNQNQAKIKMKLKEIASFNLN
jgi:hypothetical protein